MRTVELAAVLSLAGTLTAGCADHPPTATEATGASAPAQPGMLGSITVASTDAPPPILIESLTGRHEFTDEAAAQIRLKPVGRAREVVNLTEASRLAVLRITLQAGARFPWHTHPAAVMAAVTRGELLYVYADDCVERRYREGEAFVDPGFQNVHTAFNRSEGETVIIATFLGVPATGALTVPVTPDEGANLDAECGFAPGVLASH